MKLLEGIALINVVANPDEAGITGSKLLQTRITHNDGEAQLTSRVHVSDMAFRWNLEGSQSSPNRFTRPTVPVQLYRQYLSVTLALHAYLFPRGAISTFMVSRNDSTPVLHSVLSLFRE
jgi:hypothetical protein